MTSGEIWEKNLCQLANTHVNLCYTCSRFLPLLHIEFPPSSHLTFRSSTISLARNFTCYIKMANYNFYEFGKILDFIFIFTIKNGKQS